MFQAPDYAAAAPRLAEAHYSGVVLTDFGSVC
jgi:hypothetical protein